MIHTVRPRKKRNKELSMFYHNLVTITLWHIFGKLRSSSFIWPNSYNTYFTHEWLKWIWRRLIVNETELSLLSILHVAMAGTQWKRIRLIKLWKCKHYFKQTELCHSLLIFPDLGVSMKGQKLNFLEMWFSPWNSDTVRQMTFWFPLFKFI